jgi:hypothetical protein
MNTIEEKLREEIQKLKAERIIILQIATTEGFYKHYFDKLQTFKTNVDCFNYVNDLYHKYFRQYKYSGYDSFKQKIKIYIKK